MIAVFNDADSHDLIPSFVCEVKINVKLSLCLSTMPRKRVECEDRTVLTSAPRCRLSVSRCRGRWGCRSGAGVVAERNVVPQPGSESRPSELQYQMNFKKRT